MEKEPKKKPQGKERGIATEKIAIPNHFLLAGCAGAVWPCTRDQPGGIGYFMKVSATISSM